MIKKFQNNNQIMVRMGNIKTIAFLPEDCGITDAICMTHRNSIASLEDIKINFSISTTHHATLPMTEILSFYFFCRDLKNYRQSFEHCLRILLVEKNDGNNKKIFFMEKSCQ